MTIEEAYDILIGCHITAATPSCREVEDALIVALNALKQLYRTEEGTRASE